MRKLLVRFHDWVWSKCYLHVSGKSKLPEWKFEFFRDMELIVRNLRRDLVIWGVPQVQDSEVCCYDGHHVIRHNPDTQFAVYSAAAASTFVCVEYIDSDWNVIRCTAVGSIPMKSYLWEDARVIAPIVAFHRSNKRVWQYKLISR